MWWYLGIVWLLVSTPAAALTVEEQGCVQMRVRCLAERAKPTIRDFEENWSTARARLGDVPPASDDLLVLCTRAEQSCAAREGPAADRSQQKGDAFQLGNRRPRCKHVVIHLFNLVEHLHPAAAEQFQINREPPVDHPVQRQPL